jgi:hypothetical protein
MIWASVVFIVLCGGEHLGVVIVAHLAGVIVGVLLPDIHA